MGGRRAAVASVINMNIGGDFHLDNEQVNQRSLDLNLQLYDD